ncbi:hypothetical protein ACP275_04G119700 [Erythranthe tilingii]
MFIGGPTKIRAGDGLSSPEAEVRLVPVTESTTAAARGEGGDVVLDVAAVRDLHHVGSERVRAVSGDYDGRLRLPLVLRPSRSAAGRHVTSPWSPLEPAIRSLESEFSAAAAAEGNP